MQTGLSWMFIFFKKTVFFKCVYDHFIRTYMSSLLESGRGEGGGSEMIINIHKQGGGNFWGVKVADWTLAFISGY